MLLYMHGKGVVGSASLRCTYLNTCLHMEMKKKKLKLNLGDSWEHIA
jgi:hypothetical protein